MELTPDLLLEAKFAPARRGYDMAEVDDFLERCAEGLDVLLSRLRAEFDRAERAEAELGELRAGGPLVAPPTDESVPAEPAPPEAPPASDGADEVPSPDGPADGADTVAIPKVEHDLEEPLRVLIAAERTAEAAIADARTEAARLTSEAEELARAARIEAEEMVSRSRAEAEAEARAAGESARRAVEEEVDRLQRDRTTLDADVRALSSWLDEQRNRMLATARDLERLAQDPAALGAPAPPAGETGGIPQVDAGQTSDTGPGEEEDPSLFDVGDPTRAVPVVDLDD